MHQGLFQEMKLQLPPATTEPANLGESILIYGGSSSAGILAIQLCTL
jgi:NADPH:quinone reductase-like Zn-dependent oxidoreductase